MGTCVVFQVICLLTGELDDTVASWRSLSFRPSGNGPLCRRKSSRSTSSFTQSDDWRRKKKKKRNEKKRPKRRQHSTGFDLRSSVVITRHLSQPDAFLSPNSAPKLPRAADKKKKNNNNMENQKETTEVFFLKKTRTHTNQKFQINKPDRRRLSCWDFPFFLIIFFFFFVFLLLLNKKKRVDEISFSGQICLIIPRIDDEKMPSSCHNRQTTRTIKVNWIIALTYAAKKRLSTSIEFWFWRDNVKNSLQ